MQDRIIQLPRMRSVGQIKDFFSENNEPGISERELRRLAKSGKVPSIMAGRKLLLNLDALITYLSTNTLVTPDNESYNGIRRID